MARLDPNGLSKLWEFVKKRTPIVTQTTGGSERAVMSQKAVTEAVNGGLYVSLPESVNVLADSEFRVYYRNILTRDDVLLWVGYNNDLTTRYFDDYFSISCARNGSYDLPWKVYSPSGSVLQEGKITVVSSTKSPSDTTTAMVIGDSTVNNGTMTAKLAELYTTNGAKISLLGTRGGGTHEGRGGWTAEMYCTMSSYNSVENPFYNNGFDFSYYMANQNYKNLQAVAIQLGINDIFAFKGYSWAVYDSAPVLGYMDQIVESILDYDPNIKVIVNLPTPPNSNGTSFTGAYGTTQIEWFYRKNIIRFAQELAAHFKGKTGVTVSASNCILDTNTQISDGVHPTTEGYNALGQRLYEVLVSLVDGQVIVLPLLDVSARTFVRHAGGTISATHTRALDVTKCYDEVFNGTRADNSIVTTYTANGSDSLSVQVTTAGGTGINYPVALETGKSYTIKYTVDNTGRAYIMRYNADTTFKDNTLISTAVGSAVSKTFTAEDGYLYAILFCPMIKDTLVTFSGITLTENKGG